MKTIKTPILPINKTIVKTQGKHELDLEAICLFIAFGFFFDTDTYWRDEVVLSPGTTNQLDEKDTLIASKKWFDWHYSPREISFQQTLHEFTNLFETIVKEQTTNKNVILPISGGLDSRTQAAALRNHPNVKSYSYEYEHGYQETKIAKKIAATCHFPFQSFKVPKGYLWHCIEDLAEINQCYSEFTHPRQMAFFDSFRDMGDVFSLGHMGDLMFDSFGLPQLSFDEEADVLIKLLLKKGGFELANDLWQSWNLEGSFEAYFVLRLRELLKEIKIDNTNAKLRAFKTNYFVSRWSSNNLAVFEALHTVTLPYYDNRMFEFICTIPEEHLSNRQLQIAYIKQNAPDLAKITWQEQRPFNLNNYHLNKVPYNLPYRVANKTKRVYNDFCGKPYVSRNWELQFVGKENDVHLKHWLFESKLKDLIPLHIIQQFYDNFKEKDRIKYSHPVSMMLTLALFQEKFNNF
ncbi:asparagine synthase-related protein [Hyunsoonleella aestuarii]|uniref:asparagine synthase (glutamine-hydrolyzing) n=1 Tax=Hyunsoonleella aestuarii TaxID=912802 RepID=A0ABP8E733_9FLAO|nr:asparagine synthase-related protein [Hyunsoonleella aestuarii]